MTDEEIMELYKKIVGPFSYKLLTSKTHTAIDFARALLSQYEKVLQDEREECAKVCDEIVEDKNEKYNSYTPHSKEWYAAGGWACGAEQCAEAIRARGNE